MFRPSRRKKKFILHNRLHQKPRRILNFRLTLAETATTGESRRGKDKEVKLKFNCKKWTLEKLLNCTFLL